MALQWKLIYHSQSGLDQCCCSWPDGKSSRNSQQKSRLCVIVFCIINGIAACLVLMKHLAAEDIFF